jgi:hypothetical protein
VGGRNASINALEAQFPSALTPFAGREVTNLGSVRVVTATFGVSMPPNGGPCQTTSGKPCPGCCQGMYLPLDNSLESALVALNYSPYHTTVTGGLATTTYAACKWP